MKRGATDHPKVFDLCERLKIRRPAAIGYLELLFHFTAKYAPQGDVGRFSDKRIEAALDWPGAAGKLVSALCEAGWIDRDAEHRLVVHDWCDHADDSVKKRLARSGLQFVTLAAKVTGQNPVSDRKVSATQPDNGGLPEPEPEPEPMPEPSQAKPEPAAAGPPSEGDGESYESRFRAALLARGFGNPDLDPGVELLITQTSQVSKQARADPRLGADRVVDLLKRQHMKGKPTTYLLGALRDELTPRRQDRPGLRKVAG